MIIGHAELKLANARSAPVNAPIPKRNVPANEEAVPAMWGNSSSITAIAFEEIIETHPIKIATPRTSDQKPMSRLALTTNHIAITN